MSWELYRWYKRRRQGGFLETEVTDLVPTMFGTPVHPGWSLKGGETNTFLMFAATHLVEKYADRIPRLALWRRSLRGLLRFNEPTCEHQWTFPLQATQDCNVLKHRDIFHWG